LNVVAGDITLEAVATATNGRSARDAVAVTYAPPTDQVLEIAALPPSGTAPLDMQFVITAKTAVPIVQYELDLDGDGQYETSSSSPPDLVPFRYSQTGLHEARVRARDANGAVMNATAIVEVDSLALVDGIVRAQWQRFLSRLSARDVEGALQLMASDAEREKYRAPLQLIVPSLPQFAAEIAALRLIYIRGGVAHYYATRVIDGVVRGYPVYFTRGSDGAWKLVQF